MDRVDPKRQFSNPIARNIVRSQALASAVAVAETRSVNLTNWSGVALRAGDVVILDWLHELSVRLVGLADPVRIPLVVCVDIAVGEVVKCYTPSFNVVRVVADDEAVAVTDVIVPSDTVRLAKAFVPTIYEPTAEYRLGVAVTSKLAGSPGEIQVLLM